MHLGGVNKWWVWKTHQLHVNFQGLKIEYKLNDHRKKGTRKEAKTERGEAEGPGQRPGPPLPN